jgi:ABC-type multidrug transport system fused ATPase/permease subunit
MFLILTAGVFFSTFIQRYAFSYLGENLTLTVRKNLFAGIIYKDISWFDSKDRAPGILTNIVSEDISLLNGMSTETVSIFL